MDLFQEKRREHPPQIPHLLSDLKNLGFEEEQSIKINDRIKPLFPHTSALKKQVLKKGIGKGEKALKVGVVFSGGPASGGHNVVAGLMEALLTFSNGSQLIGFLDGPSGLIENRSVLLKKEKVFSYLNSGGFDLLGTGRTKIEKEEQIQAAIKHCLLLDLDGLVIIGGDDSNTNAALLAEMFLQNGCKTKVVGIPKTIDGDLQSDEIPISFGFDTACKTYSEMIGNIARDALSSRKYTHFIKLMGRSASHIALECALSTQPNLTLIGEEKKSLIEIVDQVALMVQKRSEQGKDYGVVLIPEGLIEFVPEMKRLIEGEDLQFFQSLPPTIQKQLLLDRDPHGNVKVSQIDTQVLVMNLVKEKLKKVGFGGKFSPLEHFLGYEGRAAYPSNFDASYCMVLGMTAALAIRDGLTGVICAVPNVHEKFSDWQMKAVPIVSMMGLEMRMGKEKAVIAKTLVDVNKGAYLRFSKEREKWMEEDAYLFPGPIQFFGPKEICDTSPQILKHR